jgi:molecular chaperone DnaK
MADDNTELGRFDLVGIPPAPRGVPQIEVTFDIDANGIVHVSAKDLGTGKEQSIKVTAPKKLSQEEIDRMIKEAEKFAEEDRKRKEQVEVCNQADALIYSTEKSLKEFGDKIQEVDRANIERCITALKDAIKTKDVQQIKQKMEDLTKASHKLAEQIYKAATEKQRAQQQAQQQAQQPQQEQKPQENIVDAEYRVEDEDKKDS